MKTFKEKYYNFAVSDFDGTLFRSDASVSDFTLKAIKNFTKHGGTFCICTGRMTNSIMQYCKQYDLDGYVISYNGAEIVEIKTGKVVYKNHVDTVACAKILKYAELNNLTVQVYPDNIIMVNQANEMVKSYSNIVKAPIKECNCMVSEIFEKQKLTSAKVLFYTNDQTADKTITELKQILGNNYNVIRSNAYHIDITQSSVSKGKSILKLAEILGKEQDKIICFGDERNDISMLNVAGLSVACANANSLLKEVADLITDSCDEDGVAKALIKYGV